MSKELQTEIGEPWNAKQQELYRNVAANYISAEQDYQEKVEQKIQKIKTQAGIADEQQKEVQGNAPSDANQSELQNQIAQLKDQKTASEKEEKDKSAELQKLQKDKDQIDKQIEDEQVIVERAQAIHEEQNAQNTESEAITDKQELAGAVNE